MATMTRGKQAVQGFLGVNLRRDRVSLADEELAKAINADLHEHPGIIILRRGRTKQWATALSDLVVRRLHKTSSHRYQVAGRSVYRNRDTEIIDAELSTNLFTTMMSFRPLSDTVTWVFIADNALMRKDDGTNTRIWGIARPTQAPQVRAGYTTGLTGDYIAAYTFARLVSGAVAHESSLSTSSSAVTLAANDLGIGDMNHPTDPQVTHIGIFRTVASGTSPLLGDRLEIPTTTAPSCNHVFEATNGGAALQLQWTIRDGTNNRRCTQDWEVGSTIASTDSEDASGYRVTHLWEIVNSYVTTQTKRWAYASSEADSALGAAGETDNGTPPSAAWVTSFQEHTILTRQTSNPHYLWYSKRFRPEAWPTDQFLEIGNPEDPIQCAVPIAGLLGVFTRQTKYRVLGNATSGFVAQEAISRRGTPAPLAVISSEYGLIFPHRDGVFKTSLISQDEELSGDIAPIFYGESVNDIDAINWDAASTMAGVYYQGRYYLSIPTGTNTTPNLVAVLSATTKKWYFFDHPARSLYVEEGDNAVLTAGFADGFVYDIEKVSALGDDEAGIALDVETKDYFGGELDVRKLMHWLRVDCDTEGETLSVDMYVDGVLKRTASVVSDRGRALIPWPGGSQGYTWRARFRYTGTTRIRIFGVSNVMQPLAAA